MTKITKIFAFVSLAVGGVAQTQEAPKTTQIVMTVSSDGSPVGAARMTQKLGEDGAKSISVLLDILDAKGKPSVSVRQVSSYAKDGTPVRILLETTRNGGKERTMRVATFDESGAHLIIEEKGARTPKDIPLAKESPRSNPAEFWFLRDKPTKGARTGYYRFDIAKGEWVLASTEYVGKKSVKVSGKDVELHEVRYGSSISYLDDSGMPQVVENGRLRFERIWDEEPIKK